jgi:hypothetical protein
MPRLQTFELSGMCWPGARCAAHDAQHAEHDAAAASDWRPKNLPFPPPSPADAQAPVAEQASDEPAQEYDFHDYLF